MTTNEKIKDIKVRFGLDDEHMCQLLHISKDRLKCIIDGTCEPTFSELEYIKKSLNIDMKFLTKENKRVPLSCLKISIDMSKYKNIFDAYVEVLKEYFGVSWDIYVLAKIRVRSIFNIFTRRESNKEMIFTPNYLAVKGSTRLLVNISNGTLEVTEVPIISESPRFIYKGYRYIKANKIYLEKYVPKVERYF